MQLPPPTKALWTHISSSHTKWPLLKLKFNNQSRTAAASFLSIIPQLCLCYVEHSLAQTISQVCISTVDDILARQWSLFLLFPSLAMLFMLSMLAVLVRNNISFNGFISMNSFSPYPSMQSLPCCTIYTLAVCLTSQYVRCTYLSLMAFQHVLQVWKWWLIKHIKHIELNIKPKNYIIDVLDLNQPRSVQIGLSRV